MSFRGEAVIVRIVAALFIFLAIPGIVRAESYVVSPRASAQTKASIAEGRAPEHGLPEIVDVKLTAPQQLRPGNVLVATVQTSGNVHYVEARVKYWNVALDETATGKFHLNYRVPMLPPTALGRWNLEIIARSVDGVEVKRTFPLRYSYF